MSLTGAITGSGPLTLRYGGSSANTSSVLLAPASTSSYNGTITVATANGRGRAQFNANSLDGIAAGGVTVPAGTAFTMDTLAALTANIGKFTTNANSILAYDNFVGNSVNLNTLGSDVRIGNSGTVTVAAAVTLTPFGSTYNFSPGGNFVVNTTNWLSGANNLDVRAGAIAPGAYGVANPGANSLALGGTGQTYTGTTTVSGIINNSLMGTGTTGTNLHITGDVSAAGATSVTRGGAIRLLGAAGKLSGTSGITVQGGGIFVNGDTTAANNNSVSNRISTAATLTLGGTDGGGTFTMAYAASGVHAQTFGALTIGPGANTINNVNTAAGTATLTFTNPAIVNNGGLLNIASTFTNSVFALGGAPTLTTGNTFGGGLTVNLQSVAGNPGDFMTVNGSNQIVAVGSAGALGVYTTQTNTTFDDTSFTNATNLNLDGNTPAFNKTLSGSKTINSLRTFASANFNNITLTIPTSAILTVASGGIIGTGHVGSNAGIQGSVTIAGAGTLSSGTSDMYLYGPIQTTGNPLTISASINVNSGNGALFVRSGVARLSGTANSFGISLSSAPR